MKRKLNKDEEDLERQGLTRNLKELKALKDNLAYNKALLAKQNYLREFDDTWRDFLREQKEQEDKKVFEMIEKEIEMKENNIKIAQEHIKTGVEVRENKSIG